MVQVLEDTLLGYQVEFFTNTKKKKGNYNI